jgi:hypothetical protein
MNIVYVLNRAAFHYHDANSKHSAYCILYPALILNRNFAFCSLGVCVYSALQNERVVSLQGFSRYNGDTVCFL